MLKDINNRAYARYETEDGDLIADTLENCGIPYFARYNNHELSLTYDSEYSIQVEEIIKKCTSGEYRILLREIKNRKNTDGYRILLPEIAEILETSVSLLQTRPAEIQESLCKTYTDLWHCDSLTIKATVRTSYDRYSGKRKTEEKFRTYKIGVIRHAGTGRRKKKRRSGL